MDVLSFFQQLKEPPKTTVISKLTSTLLKESIILEGSIIDSHSIVMHTVIGKDARIGQWARVEGTPNDPNPNKPFAKMENNPLFNQEGKLNPSITIVGKS